MSRTITAHTSWYNMTEVSQKACLVCEKFHSNDLCEQNMYTVGVCQLQGQLSGIHLQATSSTHWECYNCTDHLSGCLTCLDVGCSPHGIQLPAILTTPSLLSGMTPFSIHYVMIDTYPSPHRLTHCCQQFQVSHRLKVNARILATRDQLHLYTTATFEPLSQWVNDTAMVTPQNINRNKQSAGRPLNIPGQRQMHRERSTLRHTGVLSHNHTDTYTQVLGTSAYISVGSNNKCVVASLTQAY